MNYHKDKFVAKILHDEMAAMEVKKSGKVEHSDTTHDDQVFSYLMAIYVWYDGHNIMENFNIQKNIIKTDEDEEVTEGEIESGSELEKLDLEGATRIVEEDDINLGESLKYINEGIKKGKLESEFNVETYNKEGEDLNLLLATNSAARDAYNKKYHVDVSDNSIKMVNLPDELFIDDEDYDPSKEFNGNLYGDYLNL